MEELKELNSKREIHIKLCLTLAKHGFKFLGTNDLGDVSGFCQECGHPIRYEQNFKDLQDGNEYTIGSDCMFKIYILSHWGEQIEESDLEKRDLQRAGKWLWIIHRDGYLKRIKEYLEVNFEEFPQPKDYDGDFNKLANDLKAIVLRIRWEIKKEIEEEKRIEKEKLRQESITRGSEEKTQRTKEWIISQGIDIDKRNNWERDFLNTMYKAHMKGWSLSPKQENKFNKIKTEKSKQQIVESTFVGNIVSTWLINELTGNWVYGIVKSVYKETQNAILCDVSVDEPEMFLEEKWIAKSQLSEEFNL